MWRRDFFLFTLDIILDPWYTITILMMEMIMYYTGHSHVTINYCKDSIENNATAIPLALDGGLR